MEMKSSRKTPKSMKDFKCPCTDLTSLVGHWLQDIYLFLWS